MIPDKYKDLPEHIKQLFEWGDPTKPGDLHRNWKDYLPYGFSDADVPALLELLSDEALNNSLDQYQIWVPLYAWRILGQLKSVEAIGPLIDLALKLPDEQWINSEIPVVLSMIGQPAMAPIAETLLDEAEGEHVKEIAINSLAKIAPQHPELRKEVIKHFRTYLQSPNPDYHMTNGLLVSRLIDMIAVELISEIRDLYEKGYVAISAAGDIEDVEIALGFREERSTPQPRYMIPGTEGLSKMLDLFAAENLPKSDTPAQPLWGTVPDTPETYVRETAKVGRNELCPCGSGKKYKRCCMNA